LHPDITIKAARYVSRDGVRKFVCQSDTIGVKVILRLEDQNVTVPSANRVVMPGPVSQLFRYVKRGLCACVCGHAGTFENYPVCRFRLVVFQEVFFRQSLRPLRSSAD
jgi:hypothetical protein